MRSFNAKMILGVIALQAVLLVALVWSGYHFFQTTTEEQLKQRADTAARLFAMSATEAVLATDLGTLNSLLQTVLDDPGVVYARIRDDSQRVLVADGDPVILARPFVADMNLQASDDGVLDTFAEILVADSRFGRVELGFSVRELDRSVVRAGQDAALIAATGMALTILFSSVLGAHMARRLGLLNIATVRIANGEYGYQLPVQGRDELATTAQAFNAMSLRVQDADKQKQAALNAARKARDEHAVSEARLRNILDNAPDAIIMIDEHGIITAYNPGAVAIFGYEVEEAMGRNIDMLMPPAHAGAHRGYVQRFLATREERMMGGRRELAARRKDGALVPIEILVSETEVGGERNFLGVARDVSERKAAEARAHAALLEKVSAEKANRAKSQFLANMSHELRTPLNAIIGYSEILEEDAEDEGLTSFVADLQKIRSSGKHLLALISDVLDLSKIEAGRMEVYLEDVPLQEMLDQIVATVTPLAKKNDNALEVRFECLPTLLHTDATKLKQTLLNLLSNACKFTQDGQITLRVCVDEADESSQVVFEVSDSGIGIGEEQMKKLFEPFVQADASTTRKYGGTGLGLTISKHFVEMLGGSMGVSSVLGQGSRFTVRLPAAADAKLREPPSQAMA